jgi:hypothetical protein
VFCQAVGEKEQMTEINPINTEAPDSSNLPGNVRFIRGVYWFLAVCGLLIFIIDLVELDSAKINSIAESSLMIVINLLILYGLHKKKKWVVPLVLYFSAWTLFSSFIRVVGETTTTSDMMKQKVSWFLFALFSIYQLYVFRQKETKLYFSQKGQTLY